MESFVPFSGRPHRLSPRRSPRRSGTTVAASSDGSRDDQLAGSSPAPNVVRSPSREGRERRIQNCIDVVSGWLSKLEGQEETLPSGLFVELQDFRVMATCAMTVNTLVEAVVVDVELKYDELKDVVVEHYMRVDLGIELEPSETPNDSEWHAPKRRRRRSGKNDP